MAGNGDVALMSLLRLSAERGPPLLGFVQADRSTSLELLATGAVLAAGAHAGGFPTHVGGERAARIHLVNREIGLLQRKGRSPSVWRTSRSACSPRGLPRLASGCTSMPPFGRPGSTRSSPTGGPLLLPSHLEVVLAVASGRAEIGLASRAWGERAGLVFHPLATESYGLIVKAGDLGDARVVRMCELAQGERFARRWWSIPGYDAQGAGDIRYDG